MVLVIINRLHRLTIFLATLCLVSFGVQKALSGDPSDKEYKKRQDKWFTVKSWTATYKDSFWKETTWEVNSQMTVTTSVRSVNSGSITLDSSYMDFNIMEWYGIGSGTSSLKQTTVTTYSSPDGDIIITEVTEIIASGRTGDLPDEDGYRENWGGSLSIDVFSNDYSVGFGEPVDEHGTFTRTVTGMETDFSELEKLPDGLREIFMGLAAKGEEWASYSGPLEDAPGISAANILGFGLFPDTDDSVWYDLPESGLTLKGSYNGKNSSRSWSVSPGGKVDPLILEKTPEDWIPDAETQEPARITITGDGWNGEEVKVRFILYEVTKEKGFCLNSEDDNTDFDLEFDPSSSDARFDSPVETEDGWTIQTSKKVKNVSIDVFPLDWGAWGKLKAEVEIDENVWSPIFTKEGEPYITVPRDERGGRENKIADAFEIKNHLGADLQTMQDDEGARNIGDGLTAYEEYRGFMIGGDGGKHITTNSEDTLDLFIHCESPSVKRYIPDGTVVGGELVIHLLDLASDYVSETVRIINPNRGEWSVCEQHGIRLTSENIPDAGVVGRAVGACASPGTTDYVALDLGELSGMPDSEYKITIVHELMHGCSVPHHGLQNETRNLSPNIINVTEQPRPRKVALWKGVNAGDIGCTMQYGWGDFFYRRNGSLAMDATGNLIEFQNTDDKIIWNYLCDTKRGVGALQSTQLGPALIGNCISELQVTDE